MGLSATRVEAFEARSGTVGTYVTVNEDPGRWSGYTCIQAVAHSEPLRLPHRSLRGAQCYAFTVLL